MSDPTLSQNVARVCECCERDKRPDEIDWAVTRDGGDFCGECYRDLMGVLREQIDKLPKRIGLCPEHAPEFYYPLNDGESLTCPQCSLDMIVYERKS